MKKILIIDSLVLAVLVACAFLLMAHSPFPHMMPVFFIGLGLTFAGKPEIKKTPNYIASVFAGVGWVLFYMWLNGVLSTVLNPDLALWVGVFIFALLSALTHLVILDKTWFNELPMIYGAVTSVFVAGTDQLLGVILIMCFGVIIAVITGPITGKLTKNLVVEEY